MEERISPEKFTQGNITQKLQKYLPFLKQNFNAKKKCFGDKYLLPRKSRLLHRKKILSFPFCKNIIFVAFMIFFIMTISLVTVTR